MNPEIFVNLKLGMTRIIIAENLNNHVEDKFWDISNSEKTLRIHPAYDFLFVPKLAIFKLQIKNGKILGIQPIEWSILYDHICHITLYGVIYSMTSYSTVFPLHMDQSKVSSFS